MTESIFIHYHLDVAILLALTLLTLWLSRIAIRRKQADAKLPSGLFALLALILVAGIISSEYAEDDEREQIKELVSGLSPTFAYELQSKGHAKITLETSPDDSTYLDIIEREKAWLKLNPHVADIYTYRRLPDGEIVFIADSETDYNHDGKYEGDREQRTAIGEHYDNPSPETLKALDGEAAFDTEIVTDKWGTWVSFNQPMFDHQGRVEAVLGVDFPASSWLNAILVVRVTSLVISYILILTIISSTSLNILMKSEVDAHKRTELALLAAKKAADAASLAKSVFLANMSHEIRTPMNSIIGYSILLLDSPLDTEQRGYVVNLSSSADSLLVLINDILDFSKIEAGQVVLEAIPYRLDETIDNLKHLLTPNVQAKGLRFVVDIQPRGLVLVGDPLRIRQILLNLLSNAIKFTHAGEVTFDVSWMACKSIPHEGRLRCTVRDTGIGIPADKITQLFRRFSQLDASTTRRYGGSGLGLMISHELTSLMGGSIQVSSTPGQGSVFTVDIPAKLNTESLPSL